MVGTILRLFTYSDIADHLLTIVIAPAPTDYVKE